MQERIRKAKDEGFTLIELLIVIIILGILAAIVVFAVGSTRGDSLSATCKTDVKSIQLAEEAWKTKENDYTGQQSDLTDGSSGLLKAWPHHDDLTFELSQASGDDPADGGYTIAIGGDLDGTVTANSNDEDVDTACAA